MAQHQADTLPSGGVAAGAGGLPLRRPVDLIKPARFEKRPWFISWLARIVMFMGATGAVPVLAMLTVPLAPCKP